MTSQTLDLVSPELRLRDPVAVDLLSYAAGRGHPDFPCLSRTHNPSSCVPCQDFSPWVRERLRRGDVEGVGEYLWRVRQANPGVGDSEPHFRRHFLDLARAICEAPLTRHLQGTEEGLLDLRVALVLLAPHEGFSGFIMTGEAADFVTAAMCPHPFTLVDAPRLIGLRNEFVSRMAADMSFWATWPVLGGSALRSIQPPARPEVRPMLDVLAGLPLGARAHAVDVLRHLSGELRVPRTLASMSRYESRKRGLDVEESGRQILASGLVVPATDLDAWLSGWTRRDLLGFMAHLGLRARNSWTKERLVQMAKTECTEALRSRMVESGAVELAPAHLAGARVLYTHLRRVRETWRVWLGFGTGIGE